MYVFDTLSIAPPGHRLELAAFSSTKRGCLVGTLNQTKQDDGLFGADGIEIKAAAYEHKVAVGVGPELCKYSGKG
jgi:hypothetical protein